MTEPPRPPSESFGRAPEDRPAPTPPPPPPPPPSGQPGYPPPGYPPPGGYPPAGGYQAPSPGYANSDEKTWSLLAHFGGIVLGFIAPLITMLAKGNESPTVRAHSVAALNFQITWGIATIIASILAVCSFGILFFLPLITWAVVIVFSIIGGMKANEGQLYSYPMTITLVK